MNYEIPATPVLASRAPTGANGGILHGNIYLLILVVAALFMCCRNRTRG